MKMLNLFIKYARNSTRMLYVDYMVINQLTSSSNILIIFPSPHNPLHIIINMFLSIINCVLLLKHVLFAYLRF